MYGGCVNTLIFPKLMILGIDHCHARATTCDFEHCGILTSVDSDQPVQPPVCLFVCLFALRPKSTAMVIAGRSVHLTTLFPGQA